MSKFRLIDTCRIEWGRLNTIDTFDGLIGFRISRKLFLIQNFCVLYKNSVRVFYTAH